MAQTEEVKIAGKKYRRVKATKDFISVGEGETFIGYLGPLKTLVTRKHPDGIPYFEMTEAETGLVTNVWANGGLRGKITMAELKEGDLVELVHKGMVEIEDEDRGPLRVNDYDIFKLEQ